MEVHIDTLLREYDEYVASNPGASVISSKGKAWASTLLKELRKSKIRRSDIVQSLGGALLTYESQVEVWSLREQMAVASLDEGDFATAQNLITTLERQFPGSARVGRIAGMLLEAKGMYPQAINHYEEILKKDITNISIMKRKLCVKKAQQDWKGLVADLNDLVRQFPADNASWQQLAEVYLMLSDNLAAVHCLEELVLLEPRNAHYHSRLAEALYSAGGHERILTARKHYTISLTLQGARLNKRALYGLLSCCKALQTVYNFSSSGSTNKNSSSAIDNVAGGSVAVAATAIVTEEHEKKVNAELLQWSRAQLSGLVENDSDPVALVERVLSV